jgi:acyl-CoA thioesterase II
VFDLWTDLLGCLDLRVASQRSDTDSVMVFEGVSQQLDYHRVFGGQLLAQFIRAASLACPGKTAKSLHAVFAREGRAAEPVRYEATRQHEGRSFASLTIRAHQPHAALASSSVSMHTVEDGPENQDCQAVPALLDDTYRFDLDLIPWETRSADDLNAVTAGPPRLRDAGRVLRPGSAIAFSQRQRIDQHVTRHRSHIAQNINSENLILAIKE